ALVNVAGVELEGPFADKQWNGLLALMRVNMEAGIRLMHALAGMRADREELRVINTASLAAFFPMPYKALYAASKAFIMSASLALREELRGRATITVLCPAGMPTTPARVEAIDAQGAIGRITTMNTSEVARVTYDAAMRGKPVVIPGIINRVILAVSRAIPKPILATLIARRWGSVRGYA
ncbi:MAG TPA: SDR family NAD(P)-dependent oxidoreductase, partial [Coriobacteriia bacterium]|nr:SDR family NAD(P)-dependent oxidoreductase [Coriobacteriia bacterium]